MQTETIKVSGMTCGGCSSKVAHALKAVTGVHDVVVSLSENEAAVRYDEQLTSPDLMKAAVKAAGYGVNVNNATQQPQSKGCC
jgi:copper chaperone